MDAPDARRMKASLVDQVARARANLDGYYFRIEAIERTLRLKNMSDEERNNMEEELESIKKLLKVNEDILIELQKSNRKTPSLAWVVFFMCLGIYFIYAFITNPIQ